MNSAGNTPPRWAEVLLERLLPDHARETITGDLREEFVECVLPRQGKFRADLWYRRQIASFIPWFAREGSPMRKLLISVTILTLACAAWLAFMETALRHPGYAARIGIASGIALISIATIVALILHVNFRIERWLWAGAAVLIGLGAQGFLHNAHSAHFEGFILVIAIVLVAQGVLMFATMGRAGGRPPSTN